nr:uncharacterized protein LOC111417096 [Onthophagus taurus]
MAPILYTVDPSPPCRAVYMTAKAIGIELEHKIIDILKNEQLDPSFIKINPRHTVPTLIDDNLVLTDSHAITTYLTSKYAKDDGLYPKDLAKRALIDQMLHFDSSVTFPALLNIGIPLRLKLTNDISQDKVIKVQEGYSFLEKYLDGKKWVALDYPTLADIHLVSTITSCSFFVPIGDHPNILAWIQRAQKEDFYSENVKGLKDFNDLFQGFLNCLKSHFDFIGRPKMSLVLYTLDVSPPCRAVYMVAKEIGVDLKHKIINVVNKEQYNEEYIKINPKHTIPTLIDGDLILNDSHAITSYLVAKYSKNDFLYPKDVAKKALIDQMLHFDSGVMFAALAQITKSLIFEPKKGISPEHITFAETAYDFLEKYLEGKDWVATNQHTIADLHLIATVMSLNLVVSYKGRENIKNWVERCKNLACYSENVKGYQDNVDLFSAITKQ